MAQHAEEDRLRKLDKARTWTEQLEPPAKSCNDPTESLQDRGVLARESREHRGAVRASVPREFEVAWPGDVILDGSIS